MNDGLMYLGRVEWRTETDRGNLAHLRPLFEASPDSSSWLPVTYSIHDFPNRGMVTWYMPAADATTDTLWQFYVEEQPTFDAENPKHDLYRAKSAPITAREVIDLRDESDPNFARHLLTEEGLILQFTPPQQLFIWVDDQKWIGPIRLVRGDKSDTWVIDSTARQTPLPCVQALPSDQLVTLYLSGQRQFLAPRARIGPRIAQIDWAPDELVLKRVLRSLRKLDRTFVDSLKLTDNVIDRAVEVLSNAGLSDSSNTLELERLKRAKAMMDGLTNRLELMSAIEEDIFQLPSAQAQLALERGRTHEMAKAEMQAMLARELHDIEKLKADKSKLQDDKGRLEEEVSILQAALAMHSSELQDAMTKQLEAYESQPGAALQALALFRAIFETRTVALQPNRDHPHIVESNNASKPNAIQVAPLPFSIENSELNISRLADLKQLRQALRLAFRARNLSIQAARRIHASILAGGVPVVAGSDAVLALDAYATTVVGGRAIWLPVSPGMLEPANLFGRVDSTARRFIPAPGALIDLLLHAAKTKDLYLIILEGINRAAVDSYLLPVLECYAAGWQSTKQHALPLFHPRAVDDLDPYAELAWIRWPSNVVIAASLSDGAATLPLPASLWAFASLIHLDALPNPLESEIQSNPGAASEAAAFSDVSFEVWSEWQNALKSSSTLTKCKEFLSSLGDSELRFGVDTQNMWCRIEAADQLWSAGTAGKDNTVELGKTFENMILQCLVPFAVAVSQEAALLSHLTSNEALTARVQKAISLIQLATT